MSQASARRVRIQKIGLLTILHSPLQMHGRVCFLCQRYVIIIVIVIIFLPSVSMFPREFKNWKYKMQILLLLLLFFFLNLFI